MIYCQRGIGAIINKLCTQAEMKYFKTKQNKNNRMPPKELADSTSWAVIVQNNLRIPSYTRKEVRKDCTMLYQNDSGANLKKLSAQIQTKEPQQRLLE